MDVKSSTVVEFLSENKQYVAPVYQRNYAWVADKQCMVLWKDLVNLAANPESKHFLGSIVIIKLDDSLDRNFVIDGQQRLTTVQLLLMAMRDYVKERNAEDTDSNETVTEWKEAATDFIPFVGGMLLTNSGENKLELNGKDNEVFSKLVNGLSEKKLSTQEKVTNVFLNYKFFLEQLYAGLDSSESSKGVSCAELQSIIQCLIDGFEISCIVLENRDKPQRVFESLNSTGLDLQASDLIRNYVLMSSDNNQEQQDEIFTQYWHPFEELFPRNDSTHLTNFFLALVAIKQLLSGQKTLRKVGELYQTFKHYYQNDKERGALVYAQELWQYGDCYAKIMGWKQEDDRELSLIFADMRWLKGSDRNPFYSLVLYLYYSYETNRENFSRNEFIQACRNVVSFIVRRAVCSREGRDLNKLRGVLFTDLSTATNLSEQIDINFSRAVLEDTFPKDLEFEHALKTTDLYKLNRSLDLCRFVLTRLEGLNIKNSSDMSRMTIEHILPQNENLNEAWQKELGREWKGIQSLWLHRLGNLSLTFDNSGISDKPFIDKLEYYRKSDINYLNEYVVTCSHWTSEEIYTRGEILAEKCIELWSLPDTVPLEKIAKAKKGGKRKTSSLADYCGTSQSLLTVLKIVDQYIQRGLGDLAGYKRLFKRDFIEYCAYSHSLAIIQPDINNQTLKVWLHCNYNDLSTDKSSVFSRSHSWGIWHAEEVCWEIDCESESDLNAMVVISLSDAVDVVKRRFRNKLI